ncbi:MAG: PEGA domain-containing protein [Pseudomonadota bacterium]
MLGLLVAVMLVLAGTASRPARAQTPVQEPAAPEAPAASPVAAPAPTEGQPAAGGDNAAGGDADPKAAARVKLVEGSELLKQGVYSDALLRFKEAYALVPSPKIFYNFGLAYMGLGRTTAAVEAFERFLDEAADASPDLRANAERQKSQLVPQIASVTVDCDVEGAEISVDGRSYGTTPRKNPIRLDPGPHQLVVEKADMPPFAQRLNTEAGKRVTVTVSLAAATGPAPTTVVTEPTAPTEPSLPPRDWKWKAGWAVAVGAAALLGFGIYKQLDAASQYQAFNDATPTNSLGRCDADSRVIDHGGGDCTSLLHAGDKATTQALVGFIAGGVLAAGAATLLALSGREPMEHPSAGGVPSTAWACSPTVSHHQSGLSCGLRF